MRETVADSHPAVFEFYISTDEIESCQEIAQTMQRQGEAIQKVTNALREGGRVVIEESDRNGIFHILSKHDVYETDLGKIPGSDLDRVMDTLIGEDNYLNVLTRSLGTNFRIVLEQLPPSEQ